MPKVSKNKYSSKGGKSKSLSNRGSHHSYNAMTEAQLRKMLSENSGLSDQKIKSMSKLAMVEFLNQKDGKPQIFVLPSIKEETNGKSEVVIKRLMPGVCAFGRSGPVDRVEETGAPVMEDDGAFAKFGDFSVYAVIDGHGVTITEKTDMSKQPNAVVEILKSKFLTFLLEEISQAKDVPKAIAESFVKFDGALCSELAKRKMEAIGATITCVIYNQKSRRIYVANLGSCKAIVLNSAGNIILKTNLHTAKYLSSLERAEKMKNEDVQRIGNKLIGDAIVSEGNRLYVTRCIGSVFMKKDMEGKFDNINGLVSAKPSVWTMKAPLAANSHYHIILGTDEFWNKYGSETAVAQKYKQLIADGEKKEDICTYLMDELDLQDNAMVMTIALKTAN